MVGYEGLYLVSSDGRIKSLFRYKKQLKPNITREGYATIELFKNKKSKRFLIHRLVALAFIPNPDHLPQVNHIDENKLNNNVDNLEWLSSKANMNYGTRLKRQVQSAQHYYSSARIKETARENGKRARKAIVQLDIKGNIINDFNSAREANKLHGFNPSHIAECCKGKLKTSGGFVWKYKEVT